MKKAILVLIFLTAFSGLAAANTPDGGAQEKIGQFKRDNAELIQKIAAERKAYNAIIAALEKKCADSGGGIISGTAGFDKVCSLKDGGIAALLEDRQALAAASALQKDTGAFLERISSFCEQFALSGAQDCADFEQSVIAENPFWAQE